jgi:hypothetical protein
VTLPVDIDLVDAERRAAAVLDDVEVASRAWRRQNRRPRSLSAREALIVLQFEALFVGVAASNLAQGVSLSDDDRERLLVACSRIQVIVDEAVG